MGRVRNGAADWLDANRRAGNSASGDTTIDWVRTVPYIGVHLACFAVIWVGWSWAAVAVAAALYVARMFAITGFYHRYFSHRSFKTSRAFQFVMAVWGASSVQRGPLWWAAHHRHHHQHSDDEADWHSPTRRGFWFAHMGWFLTKGAFATQAKYIRDLWRFPELRFIDRHDWLVPALLAAGTYALGAILEREAPGLGTNGPQMLVWGFFISTVVNYHATYTINSLSHVFGRRRFATRGYQPQQLAAGAHHARGGVAQQSPPLLGLRAPGVLLVGDRCPRTHPQDDVVGASRVGPEAGAAARPHARPHRRAGSRLTPNQTARTLDVPNPLVSVVAFQFCWFACVGGAARGRGLAGDTRALRAVKRACPVSRAKPTGGEA